MCSRNFLSSTFLVVLGDVIAQAQPAVAAQADMLETIDMAALEEGRLDCCAITEPPKIKEGEEEHSRSSSAIAEGNSGFEEKKT